METQLRQLEESLSNDNSILFLRELLNNSESRHKHLRERSGKSSPKCGGQREVNNRESKNLEREYDEDHRKS